jgi:hypothetical protein
MPTDKVIQTASIALSYREAARSTLRILNNIERSMENNGSYLDTIKIKMAKSMNDKPSSAILPLIDSNNRKIGTFTLDLVDLSTDQKNNKLEILKAYLLQMKEAATKDYLDAQAKIDFLKSQAEK